MRRTTLVLLTVAAVVVAQPPTFAASPWTWPVTGPVIRTFDPPEDPFGSGHRGIDIAAPAGTSVVAAEAGTVSFAGRVGGELFVTVDHGGGLASTYSWLSAVGVGRNDVVGGGQVIASSGTGHPGSAEPAQLHLGVKLNGEYVDPLDYLSAASVVGLIRLAPLVPGP